MNGFGRDMVKAFLEKGKFEAITEYAKIKHPGRKRNVVLSSYKGTNIRMYTKDDSIHLMYPEDVSEIQMESVADAIAKGTIFDDAETLDNHADYLLRMNTPCRAMTRNAIDQPKHLKIVLTGVMGRMSDDGTLEIEVSGMRDGQQFIDQLKEAPSEEASKLADHYLGTDDHVSLPKDLKSDITGSKHEIEDIKKLEGEDVVDDDDFEKDEDDDDEDDMEKNHFEEGFFTRRPKRLKPIPRDVVAYITVEMKAIQDSNDQAMIAGYTCSKIELVDFYLNCIDTQDDRYIVPHPREYLVKMQQDLNSLLSQILKVKPINRSQGIWKQNVTLPEGWRG